MLPFAWYNAFDNLIPVSWHAGRVGLCAEQDNRVKVPNGTAAVSTPRHTHGESRSLEAIPGRPRKPQKAQPFLQGASQKTYEAGFSALCVIMKGAFVAENRLRRPKWAPQHFIF